MGFTIECGAIDKIWRCSPISLKHVSFWSLFFDHHLTTLESKKNCPIPIRLVTDIHPHPLLLALTTVTYHFKGYYATWDHQPPSIEGGPFTMAFSMCHRAIDLVDRVNPYWLLQYTSISYAKGLIIDSTQGKRGILLELMIANCWTSHSLGLHIEPF